MPTVSLAVTTQRIVSYSLEKASDKQMRENRRKKKRGDCVHLSASGEQMFSQLVSSGGY